MDDWEDISLRDIAPGLRELSVRHQRRDPHLHPSGWQDHRLQPSCLTRDQVQWPRARGASIGLFLRDPRNGKWATKQFERTDLRNNARHIDPRWRYVALHRH